MPAVLARAKRHYILCETAAAVIVPLFGRGLFCPVTCISDSDVAGLFLFSVFWVESFIRDREAVKLTFSVAGVAVNKSVSGMLYVVATPIGNLQDISVRALQVLEQVSLIAAEDTRHSARLLEHFSIRTPMVACHDHNERNDSAALVQRLLYGDSLALISDAGTPLVSDPGFHLVRQARAAGIQVVPVPGACAAIAALSAAGLPSDRFAFEGFLPAKATARTVRLQALSDEVRTLIFYEAPHRVLESVMAMAEVFGKERQAVLARELTKTFETIKDAPLGELAAWIAADSNQQRGECVLLVEGMDEKAGRDSLDAESQRVLSLLAAELPLKKAAALTAQITGARKNLLYQWGLEQGR